MARSTHAVPRYRVEERQRDLAAFIMGFADTRLQYEALVVLRTAQLTRARVHADLVVIEQDTETVILRRDVGTTPES